MEKLNLKPTHRAVQNYFQALNQFKAPDVAHEGAVRNVFGIQVGVSINIFVRKRAAA